MVLVLFCNAKQGMHLDEYLTFTLANNTTLHIENNVEIPGEKFYGEPLRY